MAERHKLCPLADPGLFEAESVVGSVAAKPSVAHQEGSAASLSPTPSEYLLLQRHISSAAFSAASQAQNDGLLLF